MLLEAGVATLAALVLAFGGLRFGLPAWHHLQHQRCLARIARLEIGLGIRPDPIAELRARQVNEITQAVMAGTYHHRASLDRSPGWSLAPKRPLAGWRCSCGWVNYGDARRCEAPGCTHRKPR